MIPKNLTDDMRMLDLLFNTSIGVDVIYAWHEAMKPSYGFMLVGTAVHRVGGCKPSESSTLSITHHIITQDIEHNEYSIKTSHTVQSSHTLGFSALKFIAYI